MAQMPEPLTEMPLNPTPQQAGIATRRVPKEIPDMDDPFCDPDSGLKWAELVIEQPTPLEEQRVVDFTKPFWHYLGELSTEYISKYSEDPRRRIANDAANLIPSRKSKPKRQSLQQPKAMFNAHMQQNSGYLGYSQNVLQHQQQHQQLQQQHHQIQQQRAAYNQQQQQSKGQSYHDPGYHAPVAPMMGQMPQQQLWPPIYRPPAGSPGIRQGMLLQHNMHEGSTTHVAPAAAGQFTGTVADQRRVEYVAAAALSASPHHALGFSMEKTTNPPQETGTSTKPVATSPVIQKHVPQYHASTPQKASPPQLKSSKVATNAPAPPMSSPNLGGKKPFSVPMPMSQTQPNPSEKAISQPKATPTKVVPLADIQAALARLAKAKAEAEAEVRERLQAQAQAAQAQVAALAPPPPQAA